MRGKTKFQAKKDGRERERERERAKGKWERRETCGGGLSFLLNAQRGRTSSDCFAFVVCHTTWLENLVLVGYDDQLTFTQISYDFIVSCFFSIFRQRSRSFPVRCSALAKIRVSNEKGRKKIFLSFFFYFSWRCKNDRSVAQGWALTWPMNHTTLGAPVRTRTRLGLRCNVTHKAWVQGNEPLWLKHVPWSLLCSWKKPPDTQVQWHVILNIDDTCHGHFRIATSDIHMCMELVRQLSVRLASGT